MIKGELPYINRVSNCIIGRAHHFLSYFSHSTLERISDKELVLLY